MTGNEVIQTTSVTPARVRLFQPSQRPTRRDGEWIATSWGRCRVHGRLGQRHADLVEALLYSAERRRDEDAGTIKLLIDPARVRKVMSAERYSVQQIWKLLRELRECTVEIDTAKTRVMGGVVESAEYTKKETRADPLSGEQRRLWTIRLGKAWAELMRLDLPLHYDPAPIARLDHGISQAVARHILTHKAEPRGGWTLDGLIDVVAGKISSADRRNARRRLRADAAGLEAAGIEIDGDRAHRLGVSHPPRATTQTVPQPPDGVSHPPDIVPQPPGACHTRPGPLGLSGSLEPEQAALAAAQAQAQPP